MSGQTAAAAAATAVAAACTVIAARRALAPSPRRPAFVAWTIGFALFTIAAAALWLGAANGWTDGPFRVYYLTGGILVVAYLAVGELLLVLPGRTVTRVESRPDDADVVYATVANFGNRHVFRSTDGGSTWIDIDGGGLPDAPVHCVTIPAAHPERVYICGDAGVFVSDDQGASWANLTSNLPNVIVVDLVYHETDHLLTAATYGRSIWRLQVD